MFNNDGNNIYYEVHGEGPPLLLIAGFTCNCRIWHPFLETFASDFKVIIFDNRGSGRSFDPDVAYSIDDMAEDTYQLIKQLKLDKVNVLGHSMGGAIAQVLAHRHPAKIEKLVLANSFPKFTRSISLNNENIIYLFDKGFSNDEVFNFVIPWLYSSNFLGKERALEQIRIFERTNPYPQSHLGFRRQLRALEAFDSRSWLDKIKAPTLVIGGSEDFACFGDAERLHKGIKHSKLVNFPGIGHVSFVEAPEKFLKEVLNFLLH